MGRYRLKDVLLPPSLISLLRLPLAAFVLGMSERPPLVLAALGLAGLTDILDGWLARRYAMATPTGAVVDGVTDKLFAGAVVVTLLTHYGLSVVGACALAARELVELPLVMWWALHKDKRHARAAAPKANWLGKLATVIQFITVASLTTAGPWSALLLGVSGVCGLLAGLLYWRREISR